MVATLQSRKEALEAKILQKNEELKKLCLQEADLTGVIPPEIPLEPGEPPPPIRRRVGTSFSFPQNLINNVKDADDDALNALELECKVQTNIAEAALALANDTSANKAARRKHRLMYRQSQRRLMELESKLNLLKQGKTQSFKPNQIKKKPRPNTTAVENLGLLWSKTNDNNHNISHLGLWPNKTKTDYSIDDVNENKEFLQQNDPLGNLHRSFKSSATSQSSGSPRTDVESDEFKAVANSNSFSNNFVTGYLSHPNILDVETFKLNSSPKSQHHKKNGKRTVRKQWDTQSAGGTLLPSQTYPDHSHQPNLSRTQSLGSVEANPQKPKDSWSMQDFSYESVTPKEKEWYETSLDSAPSPPLRTTSRLPQTARLLYQMQENHVRDLGIWSGNISNMQPSNSHPVLPTASNMAHKNVKRSTSACPATEGIAVGVETLTKFMEEIHLNPNPNLKGRNSQIYHKENETLNQNEIFHDYANTDNRQPFEYSAGIPKLNYEGVLYQVDLKAHMEPLLSGNTNNVFLQNCESHLGLQLIRQNSLNHPKFKNNHGSELDVKKLDDNIKLSNSIYVNIPEDNSNLPVTNWLIDDEFAHQRKGGQIAVPQEYVTKTQTPTQPYYHTLRNSPGEKIKNLQYQAARNRHASVLKEEENFQPPSPVHTLIHHPPHAITQNEISLDTVVPFESPQNHTVVQAGKWQPYREVTKPFEMSDFYKYSTKFRQSKATLGNRTATPDVSRNSPNTQHQKGVYTPLKPMTCCPVESRNNQIVMANQMDVQCDEIEKTLVEVSPPEIV